MVEVNHRVSKEATNSFFETAKKWFPRLNEAKMKEGNTSKTPRFEHIRRNIYEKNVPNISLEVSYKHKTSGEVTVLKNLKNMPVGRFPRDEYQKLYEIASVEVINCGETAGSFFLICFLFFEVAITTVYFKKKFCFVCSFHTATEAEAHRKNISKYLATFLNSEAYLVSFSVSFFQ